MKTAIIGLPMVGKTSLFTILTGVHQETHIGSTAARPGVAQNPDARLGEDCPPLARPASAGRKSRAPARGGGAPPLRAAQDRPCLRRVRGHAVDFQRDPT